MAAWGVLRMAAGVILNLIISTNPFLAIILLQAIAFSRSSYLAGVNVAVAYRMVISLLPLWRALKKSPFFMTKTENAYDL